MRKHIEIFKEVYDRSVLYNLYAEVSAVNELAFLAYDEENLIGTAVVSEDSKIIIADEIIYTLVGVAHSFTFVDYIHPDYKEEFMDANPDIIAVLEYIIEFYPVEA